MATILIVDDRPTNREFLLTLLGYGGHRLLEATDGAAALELVRAERPDLVIAGIVMPTMMAMNLSTNCAPTRPWRRPRLFSPPPITTSRKLMPWHMPAALSISLRNRASQKSCCRLLRQPLGAGQCRRYLRRRRLTDSTCVCSPTSCRRRWMS